MTALIVEDEAMARAQLIKLLSNNFPDIEVVGQTDSICSTLDYLEKKPEPEIIFMDVELADGDCFEIFRHKQVSSAVIMTTAYDSYAVKAFEAGSVDYLMKPINLRNLERAVERCRERVKDAPLDVERIIKAINGAQSKNYRERTIVRVGDKIIPIKYTDVAYFVSEEKSNYMILSDSAKYIIDSSLDALEDELNPDVFFRIGRGGIVSRNAIRSVERYYNGRLKLYLQPKPEEDMFVSRSRVDDFLQWLE